jgi:hypothetical protein
LTIFLCLDVSSSHTQLDTDLHKVFFLAAYGSNVINILVDIPRTRAP